MPLVAPSVEGPISECSDRVRVEGQLPGAEIELVVAGSVVARTTSGGSSEVVSPGGTLSPGDEVAARQRMGSTTSDLTPDPVEVQRKPDPVGSVSFAAPVLACAECVRVEGAVPGADLEVAGPGGTLGRGHALYGADHVGLRPHAPPGQQIEAGQVACRQSGSPLIVPTEPVVTDERELDLPTPKVHGPLQACRHVVPVSAVVAGARVTIHRSMSADATFCVGRAGLRWNVYLGIPLKRNESIRASQELPACNLASARSPAVEVGPPRPVETPGIEEPLCAGGTTVSVTGLDEGAEVEIAVEVPSGGAGPPRRTVYRGAAPEQGSHEFHLPPLPPRADVSARQTVCGIPSGWSAGVTVGRAPARLDTPGVPGPLFECGTVVHVTGLTPGTWVYVESDDLGAPIGKAWATSDEQDVPVAPQLAAGDEITARAVGCGQESARSTPEPVRELEELGEPTVEEPVYDCPRPIRVSDVVPGAAVDVYVNGVWAGTRVAGEDPTEVSVPASRLSAGGRVTARQRLCGRISDRSSPAPIRHFEGEWIVVGEEMAEILAVHAALLPTGEVLYFGGDQHHGAAHGSDVDNTRTYDPKTEQVTKVTGLGDSDLFCTGHAMLEEGELLVGGGTAEFENVFKGSRDSWEFDRGNGGWNRVGDLVPADPADVDGDRDRSGGRWYPALVTLADGRVLALGGEPDKDDTRDVNNSLELYDPGSQSWSRVGSTDYAEIPGAGHNARAGRDRRGLSEYLRLHVLPDESVLSVSEMDDGEVKKWNPYTDPTDWDTVQGGGLPGSYQTFPQRYTTALLPLRPDDNWTPRVLIAGMSDTYVLEPDTGNVQPISRELSGSPTRRYGVATLLPTGEVALTGGVEPGGDKDCREVDGPDEDHAVKEVELFDPEDYRAGRRPWRTGPAADVVRDYHSVALLLPDGSVWTAGSNHYGCHGGESVREDAIERYEPWYFCEPRPRIASVEDRACHGEPLRIRTPDARRVDRVVIVRCGSVTHTWNFDQRHVTLPHDVTGAREIEASVPSNRALAVPGYYLLFVLTEDRVPSTGAFVQICTSPTLTVPERPWWIDAIDWDAIDPGVIGGVLDRLSFLQERIIRPEGDEGETFDIGEIPGTGRFRCRSCGWSVALDDPSDRLPPCGNCPGDQRTVYVRV